MHPEPGRPMVNNIEQVLAASKKQLAGISESPLLDCQLMLGHILGKEREWFYIHGDEGLSEAHLLAFQKLLDRRTLGEPLAYLTGTRSFWNRDFQVTPATLIPRPDTELLIETILDQRDNAPCNVLDLGTGSGAIAITLAAERPDWRVTGVDFSAEALNTAITNGRDLSNIEWRQGNWVMVLPPNQWTSLSATHLTSLKQTHIFSILNSSHERHWQPVPTAWTAFETSSPRVIIAWYRAASLSWNMAMISRKPSWPCSQRRVTQTSRH